MLVEAYRHQHFKASRDKEIFQCTLRLAQSCGDCLRKTTKGGGSTNVVVLRTNMQRASSCPTAQAESHPDHIHNHQRLAPVPVLALAHLGGPLAPRPKRGNASHTLGRRLGTLLCRRPRLSMRPGRRSLELRTRIANAGFVELYPGPFLIIQP